MDSRVFKIAKGVVLGSDGKYYTDEVPADKLGITEKRQQKVIAILLASGQLVEVKKPKPPKPAPAKPSQKAPAYPTKKGGKK